MSYLIPIGNISLARQEGIRQAAVVAGKQALIDAAVVKSMDASIDRDPDYRIDFVPAATRAGLTGWLSQTFAAAATIYSLLADNANAALSPQVPNNAVWVFYGVHVVTLNRPATQLFFGVGNNNIRKANFDLEKLYDQLETNGYFTNPVVFGPQDIVTIQVLSRLALGVGCNIVLDSIIVEPNTVSQV